MLSSRSMTPEPPADHEYEVDVVNVVIGEIAAASVSGIVVGEVVAASVFVPPVGKRFMGIAMTSESRPPPVVEFEPPPPAIVAIERG